MERWEQGEVVEMFSDHNVGLTPVKGEKKGRG
jgi:hypothetical protein